MYLKDYISDQYFDGYYFEADMAVIESICHLTLEGDLSFLDLSKWEDRRIFLYFFDEALFKLLPEKIETALNKISKSYDDDEITMNEWYNQCMYSLESIKESYIIKTGE